MKKLSILILISILVIGFVWLIFYYLTSSMVRYSDKYYTEDGRYFAQTEEINCGATCDYDTVVSITKADKIGGDSGKLSNSVFHFDGSLFDVLLSLENNHTLKITYANCTKVYRKDNSWDGIKIIYSGKCTKGN